MSRQGALQTISKYEAFINDVLKEDLRLVEHRLQIVNAEIADLIQQKHTLKIITNTAQYPDGFKSQVDIGCNFFMEARVPDTSKMLFNIGLNHYLEFTHAEANKYIDARIEAFEEKAKELREKSSQTKAHIKLMLFGIGELQGMNTSKMMAS